MIHFHCTGCARQLKAQEDTANQQTQCPSCQTMLTIPARSERVAGSPITSPPPAGRSVKNTFNTPASVLPEREERFHEPPSSDSTARYLMIGGIVLGACFILGAFLLSGVLLLVFILSGSSSSKQATPVATSPKQVAMAPDPDGPWNMEPMGGPPPGGPGGAGDLEPPVAIGRPDPGPGGFPGVPPGGGVPGDGIPGGGFSGVPPGGGPGGFPIGDPQVVVPRKARQPQILVPEEYAVAVANVPARVLMFDEKKEKIYVVDTRGGREPLLKLIPVQDLDKFPELQDRVNPGGQPIDGFPGQGGGKGRPPGPGGLPGAGGGFGGPGGGFGNPQMRLAETVLPVRTALIVGSFPLKRQFREYAERVGYADVKDLLDHPNHYPIFKGVKVQRRVVNDPNNKDAVFQDLDVDEKLKDLFVRMGNRTESEDPKYDLVYYPRLPAARPYLLTPSANNGTSHLYPKPEDTLVKLQKSVKTQKVPVPRPEMIEGQAGGPGAGAPGAGPGGFGGPVPGGPGVGGPGGFGGPVPGGPGFAPRGLRGGNLESSIPDHCLFRTIDTTVEPGKCYEYRIKVIAANPIFNDPSAVNPKDAKPELLESEWFTIPTKVHVPLDSQVFAVDEKNEKLSSEYVVLQTHQWVQSFHLNPAKPVEKELIALGDWVINDRDVYRRGESLKTTKLLEVPTYNTLYDTFAFLGGRQNTKSSISFGPPKEEWLVVDFDGGLVKQKKLGEFAGEEVRAELPREVLILNPDGTLSVRNSDTDKTDVVRVQRSQYVKDKIQAAKGRFKDPNAPFGP